MVGARSHGVKAIAVFLALTALSGCFWRSYADRARTHGELLLSMARKGMDVMRAGRLTAESMPELTYPLERAQAFAAEARRRAGDRPPASLGALDALIARYRTFVDTLDRIRRDTRGEDAAKLLKAPLADIEHAEQALLTALGAEE